MSQRKVSGILLAWGRFKDSILDTQPKDVVKFAVFATCGILFYVQLRGCLEKLHDPPVNSETQLSFNDTIDYPALTICREPAYNRRYFQKYKFSGIRPPIESQSKVWETFPLGNNSLRNFFKEATYNDSDVIVNAVLDSSPAYIQRSSSLHLSLGICHTLKPLKNMSVLGKKYGYLVSLRHDLYEYLDYLDDDPGWHFFLHEAKEMFSENIRITASRQDHVFAGTGENIEVTIDTRQYTFAKNCSGNHGYSVSNCEHNAWIENMNGTLNCSVPWLPAKNRSECLEYEQLRVYLVETFQMQYDETWCQKACKVIQYQAKIVKRTNMSERKKYQTNVSIYFGTKSVLSMKESLAYDWNLFVSDLGGSIGFLLGLSVIGLIGILEQFVNIIFGKKEKEDIENQDKPWKYSSDSSSIRSNRSFENCPTPTVVAKFERY